MPIRRSTQPRPSRGRTALLLLVGAALLLPTGCVRRRLHVRSNPPGALVYVDNQQIGTTPCAVDFIYYGTREIRLVKPGYETLTVNQPIPAPWYQIPPIDFVAENLVPAKIRDNRTVCFNLEPQIVHPIEQVIERGEQLRREAQQAPVQPAAGLTTPREYIPPEALVPVPPGTFGPPPNPYPGPTPYPATTTPVVPLPPPPLTQPTLAPAQ